MSGKEVLNNFEKNTCVQAARFGRAVKTGSWAKATAIVGGMSAGLGALAHAEEAEAYAPVRDELRVASLKINEIALHVAEKTQDAAIDAYAEFLMYLPEAHVRLGALVGDDPGTRGGDKKVLIELAASRAMAMLGLA